MPLRRIQTEARHLMESVRISGLTETSGLESEKCGLLLAFAFPDRIAARRSSGGYLLRNGRGAAFSSLQSLAEEPYIVAVELDDKGSRRPHLTRRTGRA